MAAPFASCAHDGDKVHSESLDAQKERVEVLYPAVSRKDNTIRNAIRECSASPEAPLVIFASKLVAVERGDLPAEVLHLAEDDAERMQHDLGEDSESYFIAFARIFSGCARPGVPVYVIGPKYRPCDAVIEDKSPDETGVISVAQDGFFPMLIMGTELWPLQSAPAGNIVAIVGLGSHILKSATISSTPNCSPLSRLTVQSAPIYKVACAAENPVMIPKMIRGLGLLSKADAAVEVTVAPTGEYLIGAIGELHLERCLKDLEDRFCRGVPLLVSEPIVAFKETLVASDGAEHQALGALAKKVALRLKQRGHHFCDATR